MGPWTPLGEHCNAIIWEILSNLSDSIRIVVVFSYWTPKLARSLIVQCTLFTTSILHLRPVVVNCQPYAQRLNQQSFVRTNCILILHITWHRAFTDVFFKFTIYFFLHHVLRSEGLKVSVPQLHLLRSILLPLLPQSLLCTCSNHLHLSVYFNTQ